MMFKYKIHNKSLKIKVWNFNSLSIEFAPVNLKEELSKIQLGTHKNVKFIDVFEIGSQEMVSGYWILNLSVLPSLLNQMCVQLFR